MAFILPPSNCLFDETLNRKALIVDNYLTNQLHFQMILEDYFTKVFHTNGIDEILSYVNDNHFDLVIIDNDFLKKEYLSNTRYLWGLTERTKIVISIYEFKKHPTACFAYDTTLTKPITRTKVEKVLVKLNLIKENHRRHLENFDPLFFPEIYTERISCQNIFFKFRHNPNFLLEICEFYISHSEEFKINIEDLIAKKDRKNLGLLFRSIKNIFNLFDADFKLVLENTLNLNQISKIIENHNSFYTNLIIELIEDIEMDLTQIYDFLKKNNYLNTQRFEHIEQIRFRQKLFT